MDGRELKRTLDIHERMARCMADDRFPETGPSTRLLTVTILWVAGVEKPPQGEAWSRVRHLMNLREYALGALLKADAPRWEPGPDDYGEACEAPMIRRAGLCGGRPSPHLEARVTSPADGTWRIARFCRRHEEHARSAARADHASVRAGGYPEPVPNAGGLLPCYLTADWPDLYAWARPGWKPPSHGICADGWPVMARVTAMAPPELRAIAGGSEDGGEWAAPSLRLVTS